MVFIGLSVGYSISKSPSSQLSESKSRLRILPLNIRCTLTNHPSESEPTMVAAK